MELVLPDSDGSSLPCNTFIIDINVVEAGGKVIASVSANADGRYYPAVYRFAFRPSDDPREAVFLTHAPLNSFRKQVWCPRDETTLVRMLSRRAESILIDGVLF